MFKAKMREKVCLCSIVNHVVSFIWMILVFGSTLSFYIASHLFSFLVSMLSCCVYEMCYTYNVSL